MFHKFMEGKKMKKRGRRPKNNITINENPVFTNETDNLIISLQKKIETEVQDDIPGYEENAQCPLVENIIKGPSICWNCCYEISSGIIPIHIPNKYIDGSFYTYGHFCTYECAARHIFDSCSGQEIWDKYILLNHFYNLARGTSKEQVKLAPNRLQLRKFGGPMTIDEYHEKSSRDYDFAYIPPTIPVNHNNHQYDIKVKSGDKSELKLYRKKSVAGSNNIFDRMKIKTLSDK